MKKVFLFVVPVLFLCLLGCEEKEKEIVCKGSRDSSTAGYQLETEYIIKYKGDYVTTVEMNEMVEYVQIEGSEPEAFLDYFDATLNNRFSELNNNYGGYTYKITRNSDSISSNVIVDYSKVNIEKLVNDQPTYQSFIKEQKILVDGLVNMYENMNMTCIR